MKKLYDSFVKPQSYTIGEKVLVYDPKKRRGHFAKWDVRWVGPFVIENKLNSANYVIKKGRGKPVVIHVDRLRKLPTEIDTGDTGGSASNIPAASPPAERCVSDTAAAKAGMPATPVMAPNMVSVEAANVINPEFNRPVTRAAGTGGKHRAALLPWMRSRAAGHIPLHCPGSDVAVASPACLDDWPRPSPSPRPGPLRAAGAGRAG